MTTSESGTTSAPQGHTLYGTLSEAFIFLPTEPSLLLMRFRKPGQLLIRPNPALHLVPLAWEGLSLQSGLLGQALDADTDGRALYQAELLVRRDPINPDGCFLTAADQRRHAAHLQANELLDYDHPGVTAATAEISSGLSEYGRRNAYRVVEAVRNWLRDHIRYSLLPSSALRRIASVIADLPPEKRTDPTGILRHVVDVSDDFLDEMSRGTKLPVGLSPEATAQRLVEQLDRNLLQILWLGDTGRGDELRASRTLENRSGKCVGISNLFVALLRSLGVPAVPANGFYLTTQGYGAGHAWALAYFGEMGWRECDPTMDEYEEFQFSHHAYRFSSDETTTLPEAQYLTASTAREELEASRSLLASQTGWLDRLFSRPRARALMLLDGLGETIRR